MKFGIVGTNWITERLITAGQTIEDFEVTAVYSRTIERAHCFGDKYDIPHRFSDWQTFLSSDTFDALYIATPNLYHAQQSLDALNAGKHVLCEKPLTLSAEQGRAMFDCARKNGVVLMEAMKSTEAAAFKVLEDWVQDIGPIRRVNFHYNQYSSRYDKLKEGIIENAFKPELGNGALTDIGVYTIAPLVRLFGRPQHIMADSYLLSTGADGQGTVMARYKEMTAVLSFSKIIDSHLPSEIIGETGIITIDQISAPAAIEKQNRQGEVIERFSHDALPMSYEVAAFIENCKKGAWPTANEEMSLNTLEVMEAIKQQTQ
ncbi:Gfo/Idh/MocA family oxidoreductase [Macrococcus hajekii]|uniref:Gfo/Idh/MocA family oxidoreductase n=1 Tax=Macrococcus hajekii TaxID=198482 RepID=A0A4R6BI87_9STAP|nr:Gfo/Idh/MocA family oxidoreductase [Macrococcus hajekii]TDM01333.1 Gfo/Idh/MocA family oxidoreductase [Macrococcus hajekii]GGB10762.1 putative oxidoreductase YulF [Macrococcus hajekii]